MRLSEEREQKRTTGAKIAAEENQVAHMFSGKP
jgi:hypothetical protein